ncbi:MAG: hypothetical protein FJW27_07080 [Acidimicrobiia bacterium]|nr:hypothetical protein [Acidimicrobiia bacterium]
MTRAGRLRVAISLVLAAAALTATGVAQQRRTPLPAEPLGRTGEAIFPAFEGWGRHTDGSMVLLLGYYNRNSSQAYDIPIGPDNKIEPGGPDLGQPTHFDPRQSHGVFAIRVPKDFGNNKLTWTLTVNGQTSTVSFWMNPPYFVDFFKHAASGNTPPVVRFAEKGSTHSGPPYDVSQTLSATVGLPLPLRLWVSDAPSTQRGAEEELADIRSRTSVVDPVAIIGDQTFGGRTGGRPRGPRPDITVTWKLHRAPGEVTFAPARIPLTTGGDPGKVVEASTTATFAKPGEYVLRAQVNDDSGEDGGGDQCCWTNILVRVNVK